MFSIEQNQFPGKPRIFRVPCGFATLPMLVEPDGTRWLMLALFAESVGLSLVKDIVTKISISPRNWRTAHVDGKLCLPIDRANELMSVLRVPREKGPAIQWLGSHACKALHDFTIPEVQTPFLVAEPEPMPVSFARPAPQFYAPTVPLASPLESGLDGSEIVSIRGTRPVTSTVALARGTDNDHASVIKLVRSYAPQLERFGPIGFEIQMAGNPHGGGRPVEFAYLNEPQSTLLITFMRNSPVVVDFKVRLVEAFIALKEAAPQNPILTMSRLDLLKMAVQSEEKVLTLECKVQEQGTTIEVQQASISVMEPKADALDRLSGARGTTCISGAAKALKVKTMILTEYMEDHKWVFRRVGPRGPGEMMAFQDKINSGLLDHRIVPITHRDGSLTSKNQIIVTAKGLTKLAQGLGIAS